MKPSDIAYTRPHMPAHAKETQHTPNCQIANMEFMSSLQWLLITWISFSVSSRLGLIVCIVNIGGFFTCVYFASGSKWGLSTPLTSGEIAGEKLLLLIALHSSSLALGKDGLSLTGGQNRRLESDRTSVGSRTATWTTYSVKSAALPSISPD